MNIYEITFAYKELVRFWDASTATIDTIHIVAVSFQDALACCAGKYPDYKIRNIKQLNWDGSYPVLVADTH